MKKTVYLFMVLLPIILIAGCGGGNPGGDPAPSINFTMPGTYQGISGGSHTMPSGKTVKFYSLSAIGDSISADYTFTGGTTGSGTIECELPSSLLGQVRYFAAVVILEGDFDLQEKTQSEVIAAVGNGLILFGQTKDSSDNNMSYTLSDGITIDGLKFFGPDALGVPGTISFTLPGTYQGISGGSHTMPSGKTVKFYSLSAIGDSISADYTFTGGTTGSGTIECELPSFLLGQERYFAAVVILEGDFDLQGKTQSDVIAAVGSGLILFGQTKDSSDNNKSYTLSDGVTIDGLKFFGPDALGVPGTISFTMPGTYQGISGGSYTMPSGKTVKFYSLSAIGDSISADHTFTGGTTGSGAIECALPASLLGQVRYFAAVVILEGDFDLQGKTQSEVSAAVSSGQILFGQTRDSSSNNISYELSDGITIDGLMFFGPDAPGVPGTISFTLPGTYQDSTGGSRTMPSGKTVKFYSTPAIPEVGAFSADHTFTGGTTGSGAIECELPSSLLGQVRYFAAVVILVGDFDLQGKTQSDVMAAVGSEQILFGQTRDSSDNNISYTLSDGITIDGFMFFGK